MSDLRDSDRQRHQFAVRSLRGIRMDNKLSQREVAARMGTAQSAVSEIEAGCDVMVSTLLRYARAVGAQLTITVESDRVAELELKVERVMAELEAARAEQARLEALADA